MTLAGLARDTRFATLANAIARLPPDAFPPVAAVDEALAELAGVRFVVADRRPRRSLDDLYDARVVRGEVPTREGSWHDLLNALVWATFPKSKRALHARQHRAIVARAVDGKLPNARTRELDALAMVDEGGVLVCTDGRLVFGHAIYEGFVMGARAAVGCAVALEGPVAEADARLEARLGAALAPEHFGRLPAADAW